MFAKVEPGSEDYETTLDLRRRILRLPLGLDFSQADRDREAAHFHLAWQEHGRIVACLVLEPLGQAEIKMRQVAVEPAWQSRGIGRKLVAASEDFARQKGYQQIVAHARDTAVGFYERLGYTVDDARFFEVGIAHHRVRKALDENTASSSLPNGAG